MNTMMGRMWLAGLALGALAAGYLIVARDGNVTAMFVIPLLGSIFGILLAMAVDEVRTRSRR